jgi:hypothetical protein
MAAVLQEGRRLAAWQQLRGTLPAALCSTPAESSSSDRCHQHQQQEVIRAWQQLRGTPTPST